MTLPTPQQCLYDFDIPLDGWVREHLRVYVQAEGVIAERVDPEDTMTVFEAISGHHEEVIAEYEQQAATDTVLALMRREYEANNQQQEEEGRTQHG